MSASGFSCNLLKEFQRTYICLHMYVSVCIEGLMSEGALTCRVNAGERQTNFG